MGDSPSEEENDSVVGRTVVRQASYLGPVGERRMMHAIMEENVPMLVVDKEFQYAYKCKHCGHEWSEVHEKETETREEGSAGYTGD